jgi:hypothetical protein
MTNEERDLISKFVARVGGPPQGGFSRAVPTTGPALQPIDPEADRFIADQFQAYPEARYRVMQMAVVQEAALAEAGNRIQQLQQALQQAQQAQQQNAQQAQPQSKGFFGGLFGGAAAAPQQQSSPWNQGAPQQQQYAPPPPPQYAPNYPPNTQPGMFQQGGSGFLGSALSTAAGVAGGVVGANLLMGMFSGHSGGGMFGGGGGYGGGFGGGMPQETIIENNYAAPPGVADQSGGWDNNVQSAPDPGWDAPAPDSGGWDDNSGGGGGWDDNSNS